MDKHQIGIVLVLTALVAVCIYLGINAFSDKEKVRHDKQYILPMVPKNKEEKGFTTKLDQIAQREEEKSKEMFNNKNTKEIDLDVFGLVDTDEEKKAEYIEIGNKTLQLSKKITKKEISRNEVSKHEPNVNNPLPDPDLQFFGTNPTKTPNVPKRDEILIHAVVHDQVTVSQGERVTLRTTEDFNHGENVLPKNSFLHAMVRFSNNRVQLALPSIQFSNGTILQHPLEAYDGNDNNLGLYAPKLMENTSMNEAVSHLVSEVETQVPNSVISDLVGRVGKRKLRENEIPLRRNHPIILKQN